MTKAIKIKDLRLLKLVYLFLNNHSLTGRELCKELNVAPRTLRSYLKGVKPILADSGGEIISNASIGYELILHDEEKFYRFLEENFSDNDGNYFDYVYPSERVEYIIRKLIINEYHHVANFEEELYVSRSTITNDLREVKKKIKQYELGVESKSRRGIRLIGNEFFKRLLISDYCKISEAKHKIWLGEDVFEEKNSIRDIVLQSLEKKSIAFSQSGVERIVIYLLIALQRFNLIEESPEKEGYAINQDGIAFAVSGDILEKIGQLKTLHFSEFEQIGLAVMILSAQNLNGMLEESDLYRQATLFLIEMNQRILEHFDIDFSLDDDLNNSLCFHFVPMFYRIAYHINCQDPSLNEIKSNTILGYEISKFTANLITELKGLRVPEEEIGYLAYYYWLALEKQREVEKYKIILVVDGYQGNIDVVRHQLLNIFGNFIENILFVSPYEMERVNQAEYDLILSTIPLELKTSINMFHISTFLQDEDIELLARYFTSRNSMVLHRFFPSDFIFTDITDTTPETVLQEMISRVSKRLQLPNNYLELIQKREELSSTAYGNQTAVPHAIYPINYSTFVALAVLDKPIDWHGTPVKYVFLLNINRFEIKPTSFLTEVIATIVTNQTYIDRIQASPTINTIIEIINESNIKTKTGES